MKKILLLCALFAASFGHAVTFDDATVENHMENGWPAVSGKGQLKMITGFWQKEMTVTECSSGKKYFKRPDRPCLSLEVWRPY